MKKEKKEFVDLGHNCVCEKDTFDKVENWFNKNPEKNTQLICDLFDKMFRAESRKKF